MKHQSRIAVFGGWQHLLPLLLIRTQHFSPPLFDSLASSQLGGPWALRPASPRVCLYRGAEAHASNAYTLVSEHPGAYHSFA